MSSPCVQSVDVGVIFQRLEMAAKKTLEETASIRAIDLLALIETEAGKLKVMSMQRFVSLKDVAIGAEALAVSALLQVVLIQAHAQAVALKQTPTAGSIH